MNFLMLLPNIFPKLGIIGIGLTLNIFLITIVIVWVIIKKIIMIGSKRFLIIWKDGTQVIQRIKIKNDRAQIRPRSIIKRASEEWCPRVSPENVLPPKKSLSSYIRLWGFKQDDLIIAVEDSPECLTVKGIKTIEQLPDKIASVLLKSWSKKEISDYLKKAVALATLKRKIFDDTQFYVFLVIMFINMMLNFLIAKTIGAI